MTPDLIVFNANSLRSRLGLASVVVFALLFAWFAIRWQIGGMIANATQPTDVNAEQLAEVSVGLAPSDPAAASLLAAAGAGSVRKLLLAEEVVRLAPNDYRWRVQLGRVLEQNGQIERAEVEFRKGTELAKTYGNPRWHLGNFLLRRGRDAEAFAELRESGERSLTYREQVFSLGWDYFEKDPAQLISLAGDSTDGRVRLAFFFASRGRASDALEAWNRLSANEKQASLKAARAMADGLYGQRHFTEAIEFAWSTGLDPEARRETISNGSFEKPLGEPEGSLFGWSITRSDAKLDIAADTRVRRSGERSLKINFRNFSRSSLANIYQTAVVRPNTHYRLVLWIRTENLRSSAMPRIEILSAENDGARLAVSSLLPSGTTEWQQMFVEFTTPASVDGATIRTLREPCGEACPIDGTLWYDDFELTKL